MCQFFGLVPVLSRVTGCKKLAGLDIFQNWLDPLADLSVWLDNLVDLLDDWALDIVYSRKNKNKKLLI